MTSSSSTSSFLVLAGLIAVFQLGCGASSRKSRSPAVHDQARDFALKRLFESEHSKELPPEDLATSRASVFRVASSVEPSLVVTLAEAIHSQPVIAGLNLISTFDSILNYLAESENSARLKEVAADQWQEFEATRQKAMRSYLDALLAEEAVDASIAELADAVWSIRLSHVNQSDDFDLTDLIAMAVSVSSVQLARDNRQLPATEYDPVAAERNGLVVLGEAAIAFASATAALSPSQGSDSIRSVVRIAASAIKAAGSGETMLAARLIRNFFPVAEAGNADKAKAEVVIDAIRSGLTVFREFSTLVRSKASDHEQWVVAEELINAERNGLIEQSNSEEFDEYLEQLRSAMKAVEAAVSAPSVTEIFPGYASSNGASFLTFLGSGFSDGVAILINDQPCQSIRVVSASKVVCKTPSQAVGKADVAVRAGIHRVLYQDALQIVHPGWEAMAESSSAPSARDLHAQVMIGDRVIIWAGRRQGQVLADGAIYDILARTWTPVSTDGAPPARKGHVACAYGASMVVWGGRDGSDQYLDSGGRYILPSNEWVSVPSNSAAAGKPAACSSEYLAAWGGFDGTPNNQGFIFDFAGDRWIEISSDGAPEARASHQMHWVNHELYIWGGLGSTGLLGSGAIYNPADGKWRPMASAGAPLSRQDAAFVSAGDDMVLWGGYATAPLANGALYDAARNVWAQISRTNAPTACQSPSVASNGERILFFGGGSFSRCNISSLFSPSLNEWTTSEGHPTPRVGHSLGSNGASFIIWGGREDGAALASGWILTP
jgi:hypothetical protein